VEAMSVQPFIRCPCCGAEIEIAARQVQTELALGPISVTLKSEPDGRKQNKLDTWEHDSHAERAAGESEFESGSGNQSRSDRIHSNRIEFARIESDPTSSEEDLLESIRKVVGEADWNINGALWSWRLREFRLAMCSAISAWKSKTPEQRRAIKNRPGWLTKVFKGAARPAERKSA
jgi:hypothetical protein